MTTKITGFDGSLRTGGTATKNRSRVVSPDGSVESGSEAAEDILDLSQPEPMGVNAPSATGSPQTPMAPDPRLFPQPAARPEGPRIVNPSGAISELVNSVRLANQQIPSMVGKPNPPGRRLSHNEMMEEIVGAHDLTNQTKFYVVSKLGYHEEPVRGEDKAEIVSTESKNQSAVRSTPKQKSKSATKNKGESSNAI